MNNDVKAMQAEQASLQARLESLRHRRRMVQKHSLECQTNQKAKLLAKLRAKQHERQEAAETYASILLERESFDTFFNCAKGWNVLDDCFFIWSTGGTSFASINGCRMGADAFPLPPDLRIRNTGAGRQTPEESDVQEYPQPQQRRHFGLFQSNETRGGNRADKRKTPSSPSRTSSPPSLENSHVPWLEVNAALGHACLLLKLIQEKSYGNMKFTHDLHPMAMTSKIGIRFGRTKEQIQRAEPVMYNLYLDEDAANAATAATHSQPTSRSGGGILPFSFSMFKNQHIRNFNYALQAFLQCIAEAAEEQHRLDKTMGLPYPIECLGSEGNATRRSNNAQFHLNGGEWTVGGLPISYPVAGGTAEDRHHLGNVPTTATMEWTRACKYLLTDLKWLVAFTAKHVDR
jgi:hypothetical protein